MTWPAKLRVLGALAIAVLAATAGHVHADWNLAQQLFQNSNVNRGGKCYGFTIVWEGGRLAPAGLQDKTVHAINTANRLDANVFFLYDSVLPRRVELRSGATLPLVSARTIDELAELVQRTEWPQPPPGTAEEQWEAHRAWLAHNTKKLIGDQTNLWDRMGSLPGAYSQPITVARFDPKEVKAPDVHNVVLFVDAQRRLWVMDPNDSAHQFRQGSFDDYILSYWIQYGDGRLYRQSWNNVFFTREYIGRGDGRGPSPDPDGLPDCERPVIWEWDLDDKWLGDKEDIPSHPYDLDRPAPGIVPGDAARSGSLTFNLRAVDGSSLSVGVSVNAGDSSVAKAAKIRLAVLVIDPAEEEWRAVRSSNVVGFLHKECGLWVGVPTVTGYTDVTSSFVEFAVDFEPKYDKTVEFHYGIAGGPAKDEGQEATAEVETAYASTTLKVGMTAADITEELYAKLRGWLGPGLQRLSPTSFRYIGETSSEHARFLYDIGDEAFWVVGAGLDVRLYEPPNP